MPSPVKEIGDSEMSKHHPAPKELSGLGERDENKQSQGHVRSAKDAVSAGVQRRAL